MLKVIFLDVDGVLNSEASLTYHMKQKNPEINYDIPWRKHVRLLSELISKTDAKIVLSSTWRGGWSTWHFEMLLNGIYPKGRFNFVGKTPRCESRYRGEEIQRWLWFAQTRCEDVLVELHKKQPDLVLDDIIKEKRRLCDFGYDVKPEDMVYEIDSFVVLDDDTDMEVVWDNFVHVDRKKGLTQEDIEKAEEILNGGEEC